MKSNCKQCLISDPMRHSFWMTGWKSHSREYILGTLYSGILIMLDCYCLYLYSRIAAKTDAATSGACMADSVDQSEFADIMEVYASGQASSTVGKLKLE